MSVTRTLNLEIHEAWPWKFASSKHGNQRLLADLATTTYGSMRGGPKEEGLRRRRTLQVLDALLVPRDPRGIVLLCGFVASGAFGLVALLSPPGDPIGFAYLAVAVVGYFYIQTRGLTTFLWLLVAAGGAAAGLAGGPAGWIEFALGLGLAVVALTPLPDEVRGRPNRGDAAPAGVVISHSRNGGGRGLGLDTFDSSRKVEDSPVRTSAKAELGGSDNGAAQHTVEVPWPVIRAPIAIKAIGRLRLLVNDRNVTKRLSEQPRLEFLFSYLLARAAAGGDPNVDRPALAEEVAPGFPAPSQRDRLRKQLYALQTTLGSELKGLLQVNANRIRLELGGVDTDFGRLSEMCRLVSRRRSLIDKALGEQIRNLLDDTGAGEFLSGFSELEHQVTAGRSSAAEVVEAARQLIASQRADLAQALAEHYEASGRPQASIAYLRTALVGCPGRQDLARLLVAVYMRTGQTTLADAARLEFDLTQEK
jgi:DNA-binding SARP family transcriptional activator